MAPERIEVLARLLSSRRQAVGLSYGQLEAATGLAKSQLFKLEQGQVQKVQPSMLETLSGPLDVPLADLYAAAGFEFPTELPSFAPYLRSKYADLPPDAQAELAQNFSRIARKYGYEPAGPQPGEDES